MKKSRFTECQMVRILREVDQTSVAAAAKPHGVSEQNLHLAQALRRRFGYRRIQILMRRQGYFMTPDRAWRLWNKAGLQVPKTRMRRRVAPSRLKPLQTTGDNQVWAYDFVFD